MSYLLDLSTELKVAIIGTLTGALATIVGGGAEILIVPLLMGLGVVKNFRQGLATSLGSLLLPIGLYAVYVYRKDVLWGVSFRLAFYFVLGTILLGLWMQGQDNERHKKMFGYITIILGSIIVCCG